MGGKSSSVHYRGALITGVEVFIIINRRFSLSLDLVAERHANGRGGERRRSLGVDF